jgi:hypothetical protein
MIGLCRIQRFAESMIDEPYLTPRTPPGDEVIFLLGAGASVDAGVPAMEAMYDLFVASLSRDDLEFVESLMRRARMWAEKLGRQPKDVEILLAALERYAALEDDLSLAVAGHRAPSDCDHGNRLASSLKATIRQLCLDVVRDPGGFAYLRSLVRLANFYWGLNVFTLNYDLCVELAARVVGIRCVTGFELEWSPTLLDIEGNPEDPVVRLHKLHGSVTWYQSEDFRYLHVPVRVDGSLTNLEGTAPLREMIVYPELEKEPDLSPYPELLGRFRRLLQSVRVAVVVGYSFGDRSLATILREALGTNPHLQILIVDPVSKLGTLTTWPDDRLVQIQAGFKDVLDTDRLQPAIRSLLGARRASVSAFQSLPHARAQARQYFTTAVTQYLDVSHTSAARATVRDALEASVEPGTESLVSSPHRWIQNIPDFRDSTSPAWWAEGVPHVHDAEQFVLVTVASNTTPEVNEKVASFARARNPSGVGSSGFAAQELPYFVQRIEDLLQQLQDDTPLKQTLELLLRDLTRLHDLQSLSATQPDDWRTRAADILTTYCRESSGASQYCLGVSTSLARFS